VNVCDMDESQTSDHVKNNVVKIVNENGNFFGTGFFIVINQLKYCITCHHCINNIVDDIFIEKNNNKYLAQWNDRYSDPSKDIAVLEVGDCPIADLMYNLQALPEQLVTLWGFSAAKMKDFPQGVPGHEGKLSSNSFTYALDGGKKLSGNKPWNVQVEGSVNVFQYKGTFELGFSGAPVCYKVDHKVIGIFIAKDKENGYVLPINTLLEKFHSDVQSAYDTLDTRFLLEKGNTSFDEQNFEDAINYYNEIIADKNFIRALYNKGLALDSLGNLVEAIRWYDKTLSFEPNGVDVLYAKGRALHKLNTDRDSPNWYDKALESLYWLDKALAIDPKYVGAIIWKGNVLLELARYDESLKLYDKALDIDPNNIFSLYNKGLTFDRMDNPYEALKWYDKALDIDPKYISALLGKGFIYSKMRNYNEEIKCYDMVLDIEPKDLGALIGKGAALIDSGDNTEALIWLNKALEIEPHNNIIKANIELAKKNLGNN